MKQELVLLIIGALIIGAVGYCVVKSHLPLTEWLRLTFLGFPSDESYGVPTLKDSKELEESE